MRWIYISPHLDDAVLSAGGLIYEQTHSGIQVEIWNILCGVPPTDELSPFAQVLHFQWGIPSWQTSSAHAAQRMTKPARLSAQNPFTLISWIASTAAAKMMTGFTAIFLIPRMKTNADLPAQIAESISARLEPTDQLVCQLGLGSHVDHVLVRRAVELLQRPLLYYTDIPYLFKTPEELGPHTAGMKANAYAVGESGLRLWKEAIAAYKSQISSLFDDLDHMRSQIQQYWSENGGIQLWSA